MEGVCDGMSNLFVLSLLANCICVWLSDMCKSACLPVCVCHFVSDLSQFESLSHSLGQIVNDQSKPTETPNEREKHATNKQKASAKHGQ